MFPKKEQTWTYHLKITFNKKKINEVTITDHYQKKHREIITNELILELLKRLDGKRLKPTDYQGKRKVYRWRIKTSKKKTYRLIFWFKDNETSHLWIRNCYQIDNK